MKKKIVIFLIIIAFIAGGVSAYFYIRHQNKLEENRKILAEREEKKKAKAENNNKEEEKEDKNNPLISIPSLKNMTVEHALEKIKELGFTNVMYSTQEIESDLRDGLIVSYTPKQGSSFHKNDAIAFVFYISGGDKS